MTLKARFINLTSSYINENESIELLWNELESHYTESHRTYHNLTHLEELFEYYDTYKKELEKPDLVAFAIFIMILSTAFGIKRTKKIVQKKH